LQGSFLTDNELNKAKAKHAQRITVSNTYTEEAVCSLKTLILGREDGNNLAQVLLRSDARGSYMMSYRVNKKS